MLKRQAGLIGLSGILFLTFSFGLLLSFDTYADDVIDQIDITVPESCTMSGVGMNSHNAETNNNTYTQNIGTTTLHAFCNDNNGFAIYAVGFTRDEIGGENSNKLVGSSSVIGNIITGTATSGATSNWAMKLAITQDSGDTTGTNALVIDNSFDSYHAVPINYTKVAHKNVSTDMNETNGGVKLTTTYAVFINNTQPAGTYSGKVKYTLVHPANETPAEPQTTQTGKICYYPNTNMAEGTMGCQDIDASATSATLLAGNYSRTGYGFAGWSDVYDYSTNANAHFYGPQEDITFAAGQYTGDNDGLSLYAVWAKSEGYFQDASKKTTLCGAGGLDTAPTDGTANLSSISALTDRRDNKTYAIAKLADGKCWMIENMRLEADDTRGDTNKSFAQGYGVSTTYGDYAGLANAESANFSNSTVANSLYYSGTQSGSASVDIGTSNNPGYRMPRYNNLNTLSRASSPTSNTFPNDTTTSGIYGYGNYYTWSAAVADLSYYGSNNQSASSTSICPTGWRLPKGGNKANEANNEFWNLIVTHLNNGVKPSNYSSNDYPFFNGAAEAGPIAIILRAYPTNIIYSGYMTASAYYRGSYGRYWTSTAGSNNGSYYLGLSSSDVTPATDYIQRYRGFTIRCVAE